jgi:hypothetical protein
LPRSNVCSTPDLENPSASVHLKRFSTPSLTLKFLCAGKLNPRSLKRDIQGFKPGMTESEAKQRLSDCEVSGRKVFCPGSSKDEGFELSLTEHTRPRLVKAAWPTTESAADKTST